jgi:hypothetical protein
LRRQPDNHDVQRKMAALESGGSIIALGHDAAAPRENAPADTRAPEPTSSASVATPPPAPASPQAASAPASAAIDEGRSYEQFKRWLRTVSD